jgi:transcriptional regulator with XRE-family HTH domain
MLLRIEELRKKRKISQAKVALACGVGQRAVSQWEKGSCLPTCDKLPALANVLGCTINDLFVLSDAAAEPASVLNTNRKNC